MMRHHQNMHLINPILHHHFNHQQVPPLPYQHLNGKIEANTTTNPQNDLNNIITEHFDIQYDPRDPKYVATCHMAPLAQPQQTRRTNNELRTDADAACRKALTVMKSRLVNTTWNTRRNLLNRFNLFMQVSQLPMNALTLAAFCEATEATASSRLTYASSLKAIADEMKVDTAPLRAYMAGLRILGASTPTTQAHPATKQDVEQLVLTHPAIELALRLAWKTASRWDDVCGLTLENVFMITPTAIGIDWLGQPKSHKKDPHRPDRYVLITGEWTARIAELLLQLPRSEKVTNINTAALDRLLSGTRLTGHSFKHGAALLLIKAVLTKTITPHAMSCLMKHKHTKDAPLAPTTYRYVQDKLALAELNGSHEATAVL